MPIRSDGRRRSSVRSPRTRRASSCCSRRSAGRGSSTCSWAIPSLASADGRARSRADRRVHRCIAPPADQGDRDRAGRRVPPVRPSPRGQARVVRLGAQRRRRRSDRGRGRPVRDRRAVEAVDRRATTAGPRRHRVGRGCRRSSVVVGFAIVESDTGGDPRAAVSIDSATCVACLSEVDDPGDRRYRYPFTNCTDCGPRYTIIRAVPYDRPATTMAGFTMCPACRAEYDDPTDRRFHAQPNACADCGPQLCWTATGAGRADPVHGESALRRAVVRADGTDRSWR